MPKLPLYRNQPIDLQSKSLTSFYMMATLTLNDSMQNSGYKSGIGFFLHHTKILENQRFSDFLGGMKRVSGMKWNK